MLTHEVNFDGLVGQTHHYAGLSLGNVASARNAQTLSSPKAAALQGLQKMQMLLEMGFHQALLPPQERPEIRALRRLGFTGTDAQILGKVQQQQPKLLSACSSASSMWTANAATVSPSADTADSRVHLTPANLATHFHRSLEAATTAQILKMIFPDERYFVHHPPLPDILADEGAANHLRLTLAHDKPGVEIFVYGRSLFDQNSVHCRFPARQTLEASQAIARLHQLDPQQTLYIRQNPQVIDQGVFHNDVIAVGNTQVLLFHEEAFCESDLVVRQLRDRFRADALCFLKVSSCQIAVATAIETYLFNSQLLSLPDQSMMLMAPDECRSHPDTDRFLSELMSSGSPIQQVRYLNIRESMKNGGGPACLRLRIVLTQKELQHMNPHVLLDLEKIRKLRQWVDRHYRETLHENDLADPQLLQETRTALDELTQMLHLGSIYPFQKIGD